MPVFVYLVVRGVVHYRRYRRHKELPGRSRGETLELSQLQDGLQPLSRSSCNMFPVLKLITVLTITPRISM